MIDLPADAIKNFSVRFHPQPTFIMKRFKPNNIMHVLHDDIIPLYHTLRQLAVVSPDIELSSMDVAFVDSWDAGEYFDISRLVTGENKVLLWN